MFNEETKALVCPHGKFCIKWGCGRQHPEGRIVGYDCPHDLKCWGRGCDLHHSHEHKNSDLQKNRIRTAIDAVRIQKQQCRNVYEHLCPHGKKCWFIHKEYIPPKKEEPKKKTRVMKCSVCGQEGHNKRTCWIAKLPPPPAEWLKD